MRCSEEDCGWARLWTKGVRSGRWRRAAGAALLTIMVVQTPASARSTAALPCPSSNVWAAAVRFLRVDRGCPIREKDEAAGYVLFDYAEGGKSYHGALELVPLTDDDGRVSTQVSLSLTGLPKRFEGALLDGLATKVRDERGPAPMPLRRPARSEASDKDRPRDKDREHDGAKSPVAPDAGGLPRIPTLPSP